jgi:hypothetical protein
MTLARGTTARFIGCDIEHITFHARHLVNQSRVVVVATVVFLPPACAPHVTPRLSCRNNPNMASTEAAVSVLGPSGAGSNSNGAGQFFRSPAKTAGQTQIVSQATAPPDFHASDGYAAAVKSRNDPTIDHTGY